jgi:hypothetical protein
MKSTTTSSDSGFRARWSLVHSPAERHERAVRLLRTTARDLVETGSAQLTAEDARLPSSGERLPLIPVRIVPATCGFGDHCLVSTRVHRHRGRPKLSGPPGYRSPRVSGQSRAGWSSGWLSVNLSTCVLGLRFTNSLCSVQTRSPVSENRGKFAPFLSRNSGGGRAKSHALAQWLA